MPYFRRKSLGQIASSLPSLALLALLSGVPLLAPALPRATADALAVWWTGGNSLRLALPMSDAESRALVAALDSAYASGGSAASLEAANLPAPRAALEQLRRAEADVALLPALSLAEGGEAAGLTVIGVSGQRLAHLISPADSPLRSFDMLAGTRIGVGVVGAVEEVLARKLAETVKLDPPPKLVTGHNLDLEQAFLDGEIDAALVLRAPASPDIAALIATGYYRLLTLPANAATVWSIPGVLAANIPAQTYASPSVPELGSGTPTLGMPVYLVARPGLASATVRRLGAALDETLLRAGTGQSPVGASTALPAGWPLHPAAVQYGEGVAPATGARMATLASRALGVAALALLLWLGTRRAQSQREARRRALLFDLIQRSRTVEATLVTETAPAVLAEARRQLAAIDDEAEAAWLHGHLDASEVLLLRLGWGAELPERSADDIRARAEAVIAALPESVPPSLMERAAAVAAASRVEKKVEKSAPVKPEPPAPPRVTVRSSTRAPEPEQDFNPGPPPPRTRTWEEEMEPAPAPRPKPDRDFEMVGFASEDPHESEAQRASRFTAYTPIDVFQGNDEFGSGALLDTIRVRRSDDADDPLPTRSAPAPAREREPESLPWRQEARPVKPAAVPAQEAPARQSKPQAGDAPAPAVKTVPASTPQIPAPVKQAPVPVSPAATNGPRPAVAPPVKPSAPAPTPSPRPAPPVQDAAEARPADVPPVVEKAAPAAEPPVRAAVPASPASSSVRVDSRTPAAKQAATPREKALKEKGPRPAKQRGKQEKPEPASNPEQESKAANDAPAVDEPPSKPQLPLF